MILVHNISKLYRIYENPSGRLKEILLRGRRKYHRDFWALEDVSLEVETGEAVGVIGRNGAGKTTLLQIIAGVLQPTRGSVHVEGRVTALLELGSGFNPEYTGRENIVLSGQILGFSEAEMKKRIDLIVRFAELEGFVDQPVKTYSTGMMMRLAFASAIHVDPDVLIVDEALSVGDVYFQRKSLDRMEYFRKAGKTVLFVSHDPQLVQRFCGRAVWLEGGRVAMQGEAREVVTAYQAFCARLEDARLRDAARNGGIGSREHDEILRELQLTGSRWGNGRIRFTGVEMIDSGGRATWVFRTGEPVIIRLHYESEADFDCPVFAVDIHRYDGIFITSINNYDTHPDRIPVKKGAGSLDLEISSLDLTLNVYFLSLKVFIEPGDPDWGDPADIHNQMYQFDVVSDQVIHGLMRLDANWEAT
ncbi:MAG: ABC transporter ATP-binding protein [Acidobacteriota bacterium]|nr:MAG: ABC transporter ATP-binding protein [Acidobacteriota bacterium]